MLYGRAPQGARGLKFRQRWCFVLQNGRAPQGARGLKFLRQRRGYRPERSRPARGAWVEIELPDEVIDAMLSRPARGAWVEISFVVVSI